MANGHGGARAGAGRKCDPQIAHLRTLVGAIMTDNDRVKIIKGIVDDARSGDLRSVSFLLALRYGVSIQALLAAKEPAPNSDLSPALAGPPAVPAVPAQPIIRRVSSP